MMRVIDADVIIVGGGVAGLAAAGALGRKRITVALLEARDRLGGRIFTVHPKGWRAPVELGAEFVHAGNRALWRRIHEHRLRCRSVPPRHWLFRQDQLMPLPDLAERIMHVTGQIAPRRMRGWSFARFMRNCARDFDPNDRNLAMGFVEGFQAAPQDRMSASAIAEETLDDVDQFLLPGGYGEMVRLLEDELPGDRVTIFRQTVVTSIRWRRHAVEVRAGRRIFSARAVLLTLPLGVWLARAPLRGAVTFSPALRDKHAIVRRMGAGEVIRISFRFDARRWRTLLPEMLRRHAKSGFGFIHSRIEGVPVWWALSGAPVLTGWSGGPAAARLARRSEREIFERALQSISTILKLPRTTLRRALAAWETHNWSRDPFSRGAYSYIAAGHEDAAARLREPVQGTLFFAGEATADGEEIGTVHGALASGLRAAKEISEAR
jgi:monoamine oxidase